MGYRSMVSPNRGQGPLIPVSNQLGNSNKPLDNPMNLDELVKNFLSPDQGGLFVQNPSSSSSSSSSSSLAPVFLGNFNLNGVLSRKTADEASVINPQPLMAIDPTAVVSRQADWLKFPMPSVGDLNFQESEMGFENRIPAVEFGHPENQLELPMPMSIVPEISSDYQVGLERNHHSIKDEIKEKTIERRQKRMIKNRESAARSRARKQAHTSQLEHKVFHLRKKNSWLKKKKEINMLLSSNSTSEPRFQLRRTSSAQF